MILKFYVGKWIMSSGDAWSETCWKFSEKTLSGLSVRQFISRELWCNHEWISIILQVLISFMYRPGSRTPMKYLFGFQSLSFSLLCDINKQINLKIYALIYMHGNLVSSSVLSVVGDEKFLIYGRLKWDRSKVIQNWV